MKQCSRILDIKFYSEEEIKDCPFRLYAEAGQSYHYFSWFRIIKQTATEPIYKLSSSLFCINLETVSSLKQNYHIIIRDDKFYKMSRIEYVTGDNDTHIIYFENEEKAEESFNELMENNKSNLINVASMDDYLNYNSAQQPENIKEK